MTKNYAAPLLAAAIMGLALVLPAHAALVTDTSSFGAFSVSDFNQFNSGYVFTSGPTEVSNVPGVSITFTSTNSATQGGSVLGNGGYGLGSNGLWTGANGGFSGVNSPSDDSMTFTFNNGPVSAAGGFINYAPGFGSDSLIEALDSSGNVLQSYDINTLAPFTATGNDQGEFLGITSGSSDIAALRVSSNYIVLDNLTFSNSSVVPEPAPATTGAMGVLSVCALMFFARKRRTA